MERDIPEKYQKLMEEAVGELWRLRTGHSVYNRGITVGGELMCVCISDAIANKRVCLKEDRWYRRAWKPNLQFFISAQIANMKMVNIGAGGSQLTGVEEGYIFTGEYILEALSPIGAKNNVKIRANTSFGGDAEVRGSVSGATGSSDSGDAPRGNGKA